MSNEKFLSLLFLHFLSTFFHAVPCARLAWFVLTYPIPFPYPTLPCTIHLYRILCYLTIILFCTEESVSRLSMFVCPCIYLFSFFPSSTSPLPLAAAINSRYQIKNEQLLCTYLYTLLISEQVSQSAGHCKGHWPCMMYQARRRTRALSDTTSKALPFYYLLRFLLFPHFFLPFPSPSSLLTPPSPSSLVAPPSLLCAYLLPFPFFVPLSLYFLLPILRKPQRSQNLVKLYNNHYSMSIMYVLVHQSEFSSNFYFDRSLFDFIHIRVSPFFLHTHGD